MPSIKWDTDLEGIGLDIARTRARLVRVMAGPGTGKSFDLRRRVHRLLEEEGISPKRILVVTFTRTAAADLSRELTSMGVKGCDKIDGRTLHSFCFSLLTKAAVLPFTERKARPLTTVSKSAVLGFEAAPMLVDLGNGYGDKRNRTKRVLAYEASWARQQHDTPGWTQSTVDQQFERDLVSWLKFHEAMLIGEVVPIALKYLRDNPLCPELDAYDHVIVDEYQDLNKAEQVLVDLLAAKGALFVVGDEDQSIYGFRYAHPEGIQEFSATHPGTEDKSLIKCRRCPTRVVEMAKNLIHLNHPVGAASVLEPMEDKPEGIVKIVQWSTLAEEAAGLALYVQNLIQSKRYIPEDILILCPRKIIGYGIRNAIRDRGVPIHGFYTEEALEELPAQRAFALLTLLANQDDRVALRYLLGFQSNTWLKNQYQKLRAFCEQSGIAPWAVLEQIKAGNQLFKGIPQLIASFDTINEELEVRRKLVGKELFDSLFPVSDVWAQTLRELMSLRVGDDIPADELQNLIRETVTQPDIPVPRDYVSIMSPHKAKGLTSKVVLIAGCIQGLLPKPSIDATPNEAVKSLQEQRRLFYVAITRPKEVLIISSALQIEHSLALNVGAVTYGGNRVYAHTIASQYIGELGPCAPRTVSGAAWQANGFI